MHDKIIAYCEEATLSFSPASQLIVTDYVHQLDYIPQSKFFLWAIYMAHPFESNSLRIYRDEEGYITGYSLAEAAYMLAMFTTAPKRRPDIPPSTCVLASRQGLHIRPDSETNWTTLFWQPIED